MAAAVLNPMAIAGLGKALDAPDMNAAGILTSTVSTLEIIQNYGMGDVFGVHALRSHGALPVGTVRLESNVGLKELTWTKATVVEKPDANNMHATFFKFSEDSVVPFEFSEGPSPFDMDKVPVDFISNIGTYLAKHDLTNVIALQVGNFAKPDGVEPEPTAECQPVGTRLSTPCFRMEVGTTTVKRTSWPHWSSILVEQGIIFK